MSAWREGERIAYTCSEAEISTQAPPMPLIKHWRVLFWVTQVYMAMLTMTEKCFSLKTQCLRGGLEIYFSVKNICLSFQWNVTMCARGPLLHNGLSWRCPALQQVRMKRSMWVTASSGWWMIQTSTTAGYPPTHWSAFSSTLLLLHCWLNKPHVVDDKDTFVFWQMSFMFGSQALG